MSQYFWTTLSTFKQSHMYWFEPLKRANTIFHKTHIETVLISKKIGNETVKDCLQSLLRYCYQTEGFMANPLLLQDYAEIFADRKPYL